MSGGQEIPVERLLQPGAILSARAAIAELYMDQKVVDYIVARYGRFSRCDRCFRYDWQDRSIRCVRSADSFQGMVPAAPVPDTD